MLFSTNLFENINATDTIGADGCMQMGMGALFHAGVEEFVEGKNPPADPLAVSRACYLAAIIYLGLFIYSFINAYYHSKEQQREQRYSGI
eukprot:jgi/Hompol1/2430/HPOL_005996-RA